MGKKMFDYVIGNPPYQEDIENKGDRANPVYDKFMDASFELADAVELIHPARFLFNAGQTSKQWNQKMLGDEHFKVLYYEPDASKIFANTEIKGGIAVTYRDKRKNFGAIGTFTIFPELNSIIHKVRKMEGDKPRLDSIIASQGLYRFTNKLFEDYPEISNLSGTGTRNKIVSSLMAKAPNIFRNSEFEGSIRMLGRISGQREYRYISREYVENNAYIDTYNLFLPEANNSGNYGETLTQPTLGLPGDVSADTFLSAGQFENIEEPNNLNKYLMTKFFRAMLGIKKVTQHCPPAVWSMIPLQDFTENSDIDWSKSVREIDMQLYKKYGLDKGEIEFIETHVKEMER